LKRQRPPSPARLPPSVQNQNAVSSSSVPATSGTDAASSAGVIDAGPGQAETSEKPIPGKSKEAKLFELQLRKLRIGAKPLEPRQKPDKDRRFFEVKWGVTDSEAVENWKESGKVLAGTEKVWIHQVSFARGRS
jgi:hypothetical protein